MKRTSRNKKAMEMQDVMVGSHAIESRDANSLLMSRLNLYTKTFTIHPVVIHPLRTAPSSAVYKHVVR